MNRITMKMFASLLSLAASAALALAAEPTLKVGDPAPKLATGKWVQGEPVKQFEKGKAYIVEFWATWCGPCRGSIPHLNEVYTKYKDKGLVVVGQNCWERDENRVAPFIKNMGDKMTYRVALDDKEGNKNGKMAETWMTAAGQDGIPTAFLVDKGGLIAWIGHPMTLKDEVIEEVLAGKFDVKKAAEEYAKKLKNEMQLRTVQSELSHAMQEKNWDKAAAKLAEEEKLLPEDERGGLDFTRFSILIGKKDYAAADKLAATMKETYKNDPRLQDELDMRRLDILILTKEYPAMYKLVAQISETHKDNAMLQNILAWRIATEKGIEQRDLALAETIATRANEAANGKDAQILDTLARVLFMQGKKQKAIELEENAVSLATDRDKEQLQNTLDSYRKDVLPKAE